MLLNVASEYIYALGRVYPTDPPLPTTATCSLLEGCAYDEIRRGCYRCRAHPQRPVHECGGANRCDRSYVNRDCTVVCQISGKCLSQRVNNSKYGRVHKNVDLSCGSGGPTATATATASPTPSASAVLLRKQRKDKLPAVARRVVVTLLYCAAARGRDNKKKMQSVKETIKKRVSRLRKDTKQNTKQSEIDRILTRSIRAIGIRPPLAFDEARVQHYVDVVTVLYGHLERSPHFNGFATPLRAGEIHVLGTLYMLQYGYAVDGKDVLARDVFLFDHLPHIGDFRHYNLRRRDVVTGKNQLMRGLRSMDATQRQEIDNETTHTETVEYMHT